MDPVANNDPESGSLRTYVPNVDNFQVELANCYGHHHSIFLSSWPPPSKLQVSAFSRKIFYNFEMAYYLAWGVSGCILTGRSFRIVVILPAFNWTIYDAPFCVPRRSTVNLAKPSTSLKNREWRGGQSGNTMTFTKHLDVFLTSALHGELLKNKSVISVHPRSALLQLLQTVCSEVAVNKDGTWIY